MKEVLQEVPRIDRVKLPDGQVVEKSTGTIDYWVIRAAPRTDPSAEYIRRQHTDGSSFRWNAPVEDWNESVTEDDDRWIREH